MSRSDLEQIATEAHAAGEDTFAYGRVHAREERRAAELDAEFTSVWADLTRPRLRKWLR
jgi:hypothetical protein